MRSFVALMIISLASFGCAHQPQPIVAPPAPKPEVKRNRAAEVCALGASKIDPEARCSMWSGRETEMPEEVDAVVCVLPTMIVYCSAPDNDRPRFEPVLEWPKPVVEVPPSSPAPAAAQPTAPAKPRAAKK